MATSNQPQGVSFRSLWWVMQAIVAGCFVLVGLVMLIYGSGDLFASVIGAAVAVPFAWILLRAPFQRVRVDQRGVAQHGLLRTSRLAWTDIAAVRLERIDERLEIGVYAPALVLSDGQVWPLRLLAGYSTSGRAPRTRMATQAASIEQLRPK